MFDQNAILEIVAIMGDARPALQHICLSTYCISGSLPFSCSRPFSSCCSGYGKIYIFYLDPGHVRVVKIQARSDVQSK